MMKKNTFDNVSYIDAQHEARNELVNQICNALRVGCARQEIRGQLDKLQDLTQIHFMEEEELMKRYGYEELKSHKNIHQILSNKLIQLSQDILGLFNQENKSKLLTFLETEYMGHVLEDQKACQEGEMGREFIYQRLKIHEVSFREPTVGSREDVPKTWISAALAMRGLVKSS